MVLKIEAGSGEQLDEIISALYSVGVSVEEIHDVQVEAGEYSPAETSAKRKTVRAELTVSWEGGNEH